MIHNQNNDKERPVQAIGQAALAGTIATLPMTLFMFATQRFLPEDQRYHLPPEILTREFSQRAHLNWHWSKRRLLGATLLSHFSYGAAMGAAYSPLEERSLIPAPWQCILFGLGVWATSYLGVLPLTGFSPVAHREPLLRNLMMMGAHVVWGSAMGMTTAMLRRKTGEVQHVAQRYPHPASYVEQYPASYVVQ